MDNRREEYTITWFIENYSYCWHEIGEELTSPEFTAEVFEGTVWTLGLCPRGYEEDDKGYISLSLKREEMDEGPEEFLLNFELFFLSADGSALAREEFECKFKREEGINSFVEMEEVLLCKKTDYLPQDTLSVCCKMWKGEGKIIRKTRISFRTRIGIDKFSFPYLLENFSSFELNQKETVCIKSPSKTGFGLSCSLYFSDGSCCDGKIIVEVAPSDASQILSNYKLFLLDGSGEITLHCEADNRLDATRKNIQKLVFPLTRQDILNKKSDYLTDDKLTLLCECTFATGVQFQKIESTVLELPSISSDEIINNYRIRSIYSDSKLLLECSSALDDFKDIYNNPLLADVELKTKTKSFPAHKIVLCARSSVFKAMLTNDMKEKNTDCIKLDDMENDTVQQFLLFLYSDELENLEWESAIKLYYASDKYDAKKLKIACASFLVDNLGISTASELLLLADTHNDSQLRKAVEDFILNHEEVFGSDEWGNLLETHPLLVSRTMRLKYKR